MRNERFHALLKEIADLHDSKNHDYAAETDPLSNFKLCEPFGVSPFKGVMVRLSDKWSRLGQLVGGKSPKHESVRDTLMDTAVYSLLAILLLEDEDNARMATALTRPARRNETHSIGCHCEICTTVL